MALHSDQQPSNRQPRDAGQLRDVADDSTVTEPTIKVPVPSPGWIVIVAGTSDRASAAELPRAAFRDPALTRLLSVLDSEMAKNAE